MCTTLTPDKPSSSAAETIVGIEDVNNTDWN